MYDEKILKMSWSPHSFTNSKFSENILQQSNRVLFICCCLFIKPNKTRSDCLLFTEFGIWDLEIRETLKWKKIEKKLSLSHPSLDSLTNLIEFCSFPFLQNQIRNNTIVKILNWKLKIRETLRWIFEKKLSLSHPSLDNMSKANWTPSFTLACTPSRKIWKAEGNWIF